MKCAFLTGNFFIVTKTKKVTLEEFENILLSSSKSEFLTWVVLTSQTSYRASTNEINRCNN